MRVVEAPDELALHGAVLSIGNFDGVHLGHRMLLGRMRGLARELGRPAVVVTFFPPAKVVFGNATFLSSAEEKLDLLRAFAPDAVVLVPFSRDYARTDKAVFVAQLAALSPHTIIVGEDFRFGHQRAGGLQDLSPVTDHLESYGLKRLHGEVVKSSRIREHLARGDVARANTLLGAPYRIRGEVLEGQRRGRTLGFPTANVATDPRKALPTGVFAVRVEVDGDPRRFDGMANVGPRPSFPDEPPALEAHLFDASPELYGRTVTVSLHAYLRAQRRFDGLEALRAQLEVDAGAARAALAAEPGTR